MKIQCSCGTKYNFEVTPDMADHPVTFVCQKCGADSSEFVNQLIQQEFANQTGAPVPASNLAPEASATPPHSGLRIAHEEQTAPAPQEPEVESKFCPRHRHEKVTGRCVICEKPICPRCMDVFGNTCSPACKAEAARTGLAVRPKLDRLESREEALWKKTGWMFGTGALAIVVFLSAWTWYAWYGSIAHPYFKVHFDTRAYSGKYWEIAEPAGDKLHALARSRSLWDSALTAPPGAFAALAAAAGKPLYFNAIGPVREPLRSAALPRPGDLHGR